MGYFCITGHAQQVLVPGMKKYGYYSNNENWKKFEELKITEKKKKQRREIINHDQNHSNIKKKLV